MADEPTLPYCAFPPVMKVYYQWNSQGINVFHVCDTNQRDQLFAVKVHTGNIMSEPLGENHGIYLYNGITTQAPLLAAAGDESSLFTRLPVDNNSRIWIPARKSDGFTTETMRAYLTQDKHAAFQFSAEIRSSEKWHRQLFEWRNINKSERGGEDGAEHGGFRLFLIPEDESNGQSTSTGELVAVLEWRSFWSSPMHPFDLKLVGRGLGFGDHCSLMFLITALRLWELHARGKSQRGSVAVAGLFGSKEKSVN